MMDGAHIHLNVRQLERTLDWIDRIWKTQPVYRDRDMAVLPFGLITVIFDRALKDSPATLAYLSRNCDADYRKVIRRGAKPLEPPADRPYGVRSAYVKGPGALIFEIEQPLKKRR
jgi:hypothetical protein